MLTDIAKYTQLQAIPTITARIQMVPQQMATTRIHTATGNAYHNSQNTHSLDHPIPLA
jgi:hypothetical protein